MVKIRSPFVFVLAALLAAASARAASYRAVPGVPVQMSLPFAAVTAAPAASLAPSLLPSAPAALPAAVPVAAAPAAAPVAAVPAAAPATSAARWGDMPASVARALRAGDAREFWEACRRSGFEPPASDDHQQRLLADGWAQAAADASFDRPLGWGETAAPAPAPKARATKIDYDAFGAELRRRGTPDEGVFAQAALKRAILKAAGYTHLYGQGGVRVSLDEATDARVGAAFAKTLASWRRRAAR